MLSGCACALSGAAITSTIEVVNGTTSNGSPNSLASATMVPMPSPPPAAVITGRVKVSRNDMQRRGRKLRARAAQGSGTVFLRFDPCTLVTALPPDRTVAASMLRTCCSAIDLWHRVDQPYSDMHVLSE